VNTALFDVGGTNTRLAVVEKDKLKLLAKVATEKESNPIQFLQNLIDSHLELDEIETVILALPGETQDCTLVHAPNLPEWSGVDFKSLINDQVVVVNDADAAALGEAHYGAGKNFTRFGYVTISTGVGGGLVEHGRLAAQQLGFEVGKQIIDWQTSESLEELVGGSSIKQRTGKLTGQISSEAELKVISLQLASGLFNTALLWSTNELVINGPSFFESENLYKKLQEQFRQTVSESALHQSISISLAECGDKAGLYGCMFLADNI